MISPIFELPPLPTPPTPLPLLFFLVFKEMACPNNPLIFKPFDTFNSNVALIPLSICELINLWKDCLNIAVVKSSLCTTTPPVLSIRTSISLNPI
ncbi:unnamed protein product [[Candida] boidinii]|nr:unnamed protein product [[Candida] boidinii]